MKLCAHCLHEHPQYNHVRLDNGLQFYGLEIADIEGYPLFGNRLFHCLLRNSSGGESSHSQKIAA
jgi:hypothetical protein